MASRSNLPSSPIARSTSHHLHPPSRAASERATPAKHTERAAGNAARNRGRSMTMTDIGEVVLVEAGRADIALVNDMARFYLYDIARQIGPHDEWVASADWMRERKDFSGAWDEGQPSVPHRGRWRPRRLLPGRPLRPRARHRLEHEPVLRNGSLGRARGGPKGGGRGIRSLRGPLAGDANPGEHGRRAVLAPDHRHLRKGRLRGAARPGAGARQHPPQRDDLHVTRFASVTRQGQRRSWAATAARLDNLRRPARRSAAISSPPPRGTCCAADPG